MSTSQDRAQITDEMRDEDREQWAEHHDGPQWGDHEWH